MFKKLLKTIKGTNNNLSDLFADENVVVFAGVEGNPVGNTMELGLYVCDPNLQTETDLIWLPAETTNEGLMQQFCEMANGQVFKIVESEQAGPVSEDIKDIEVEGYPVLVLEERDHDAAIILN